MVSNAEALRSSPQHPTVTVDHRRVAGQAATEEHEPGLSPAMRKLEAKARVALRLLDEAAPPHTG
jgi:hypothetical protein